MLFCFWFDNAPVSNGFLRTPLDEWSARRRDLYLTTHNIPNIPKGQISMPQVGFEHTISAGERPQTYTLDRAIHLQHKAISSFVVRRVSLVPTSCLEHQQYYWTI